MSWAKLDDRFHENRKIKRAWRRCPAALGLHVMAITYCAGHDTNGLVDVEFVEEKVPAKRDRDRAVHTLVEAGLWHEADDGWMVHDFLEFNPSREQRAADHEAKSEAGRKGAAARWGDGTRHAGAKADAIAPANGTAHGSDAPVPTRPEPDPSRSHSSALADEEEMPEVSRLCVLLADLIEANGSKRPTITKAWRDSARLLTTRDGRRPDDIEAVIRWCQASEFWRSNVLSMPKFREKYDQLRLRMETERSGPTREHPADRNVAEILALRETA